MVCCITVPQGYNDFKGEVMTDSHSCFRNVRVTRDRKKQDFIYLFVYFILFGQLFRLQAKALQSQGSLKLAIYIISYVSFKLFITDP